MSTFQIVFLIKRKNKRNSAFSGLLFVNVELIEISRLKASLYKIINFFRKYFM